ncbi:EamA family transporter [bacterium]|nr:EamA family transporter [bacterium]
MTESPERSPRGSARATSLGVLAVVFWGSTIPVSRSLTESLGVFTAAACVYLGAGVLGMVHAIATGKWRALRQTSPRYLLVCGGLMVAYTVLLYWAIGSAVSRAHVVQVILANYLWPGLTLLFALPILGARARRPVLLAGVVVCMLGVGLVIGAGGIRLSGSELLGRQGLVVLAGVLAAVCWALYSNLARLWGQDAERSGMPLFLLAAGLCLFGIRLFVQEESHWGSRQCAEAAFLIVFPTLLAYVFWDVAVRRGDSSTVAALSYFIPVLSLLVSSIYLGIPVSLVQWAGCGIIVVGSCICRLATRRTEGGAAEDEL